MTGGLTRRSVLRPVGGFEMGYVEQTRQLTLETAAASVIVSRRTR